MIDLCNSMPRILGSTSSFKTSLVFLSTFRNIPVSACLEKVENSTFLKSTITSSNSFGEYSHNKDIRHWLIVTDLPEPVPPTIRQCTFLSSKYIG